MATYIEAADMLMNKTHREFVAEFADPAMEEHFFEVFDRAYEKGTLTYAVCHRCRGLGSESTRT